MNQNVHVVPNGIYWAVIIEGNANPVRITGTQQSAIDFGKEIAKRERSELIIHGADGKIRQKDSYGNDSFPPRG